MSYLYPIHELSLSDNESPSAIIHLQPMSETFCKFGDRSTSRYLSLKVCRCSQKRILSLALDEILLTLGLSCDNRVGRKGWLRR